MAGRGRTKRTERVPFGVRKQRMSLDDATKKRLDSDGLIPRWINDENHGQRLKDAQAGGYNFVMPIGDEQVGTKKEVVERDRHMRKLVGRHRDGSPKYAYLMAIKKEFYEEDKARKEEVNKMVDEAILGGTPKGLQDHGVDPSKGRTHIKNINYKP